MALARVMLMSRGAVAPIARVAGARFMHASAALAADAAQDPADFEPLQLEDALANELNFEQVSTAGRRFFAKLCWYEKRGQCRRATDLIPPETTAILNHFDVCVYLDV